MTAASEPDAPGAASTPSEAGTPGAASTPSEAGAAHERTAAGYPPVEVLDCRGQRCPLPVIALAKHLPGRPAGTVVRVLADDPAAANDIPAWCRMRGYEFLGSPDPDSYDVGSPSGSGRNTG